MDHWNPVNSFAAADIQLLSTFVTMHPQNTQHLLAMSLLGIIAVGFWDEYPSATLPSEEGGVHMQAFSQSFSAIAARAVGALVQNAQGLSHAANCRLL